jgi:hypothetical protein
VAADVEEGAAVTEAVLEVGQVVADAVKGAEPLDKARSDLLTESRWGSWPELDSGRRRALPHGGCYSKMMWKQTVLVRGDDQPVGNPKRKV